jgi:heat shock protein HslJ
MNFQFIHKKGGCNTQKSDYQAYSNGNINFGPSFFSTRMGCEDDKDYVFVNALKNSKSFSNTGNSKSFSNTGGLIILKDSKGKVTMNLMPNQLSVLKFQLLSH